MKGKKTYGVVILALIYAAGIKLNLWPRDPEVWASIGALAIAALRSGIKKA